MTYDINSIIYDINIIIDDINIKSALRQTSKFKSKRKWTSDLEISTPILWRTKQSQ